MFNAHLHPGNAFWFTGTPYSISTKYTSLRVGVAALSAAVRERAADRAWEVDIAERRLSWLWRNGDGRVSAPDKGVIWAVVLHDYPYGRDALTHWNSGAQLTEQAFQTITGIPSSTQLAAPAYGASA